MPKKPKPSPSEACEGGGFDMTPMIDVTFLLIIFFMCVTEMQDAAKSNLKLPRSQHGEKDDQPVPGRIVLNVLEDGTVEINRRAYPLEVLKDMLKEHYTLSMRAGQEHSEAAVLIRGDKNAEWGMIQRVMAACMEAKLWKIAFSSHDPLQGAGGNQPAP